MLDVKTVADRLGVSIFTIYREIESGKLPAYQIRGSMRVKDVDYDDYLEAQKVKPGIVTQPFKKAVKPALKKPEIDIKAFQPEPLYTGRTSKAKREAALAGYKKGAGIGST